MLQISQYSNFKYFEIIPLLLCVISLVVFVKLIIKHLKKNNVSSKISNLIETIKNKFAKKSEITEVYENQKIEKNEKIIESKNKLAESPTVEAITKRLTEKIEKTSFSSKQKIIDITSLKIIPILFLILLFIWTILNFIPATVNNFFPADSEQILTLNNNSNKEQIIILLGRISRSNDWKPIMPYSPTIQGDYSIKLEKNEKRTVKLRTGKNDIDHLMIANLSKNIANEITGITLTVPRNEVAIYTKQMNKIDTKPRIFLFSLVLNICLYFTAIIFCIWFFLNEFARMENKKIKNIIILSASCVIPAVGFGFIFCWNLRTFFLLL